MISCRSLIRKHIGLLNPGELFTTRDLLSYGSRNAVDRCTYLMVKAGIFTRLAYGVFVVTAGRRSIYSVDEVAECKARAFGRSPYAHGSNFVVSGWISDSISFSITGTKTEKDVLRRELKGVEPEVDRGVEPEADKGVVGDELQWQQQMERSSEELSNLNSASLGASLRGFLCAAPPSAEYVYCSKAAGSKFICQPDLTVDETIQIRLRNCCPKLLRYRDTKIGKAIRSLVRLGKNAAEDGAAIAALAQMNYVERSELRMANAWMPSWLSDLFINKQSCIDSANRFWKMRRDLLEQKT